MRWIFWDISKSRPSAYAPTTRAMIVTILYRLENSSNSNLQSSISFTDVEPGSWYEEAVNWAAANGIITGVTDKTLVPQGKSTRAQAATMLMRYCKSN